MTSYTHTSGSVPPHEVAPPAGPPPPQVPSGWLARWGYRYNTFFYVDLATGKSQWEKPPGTIDAITPNSNSAQAGPSTDSQLRPPPYESTLSSSSVPRTTNLSSSSLPQDKSSNQQQQQKPYSSLIPPSVQQQYPAHSPNSLSAPPSPSPQSQTKPRGLAGKLSRFLSSHAYPRPPYPAGVALYNTSPHPQPYYGTNQYRPMLYGQPHMMYTGGHGHGRRYGGIGSGGATAMGLGGGLLGGMLLADAMDNDYAEGFADGADYGGGDFGGGDFGGGDFGGGDFDF